MGKGLQPVLLGFTLTIGTALCWGFVGVYIVEAFTTRRWEVPHKGLVYSSALDTLIVAQNSAGDYAPQRYFDLNGLELHDIRSDQIVGADGISINPRYAFVKTHNGVMSLAACGLGKECWYLVDVGAGRGYFECYDRQSNLRIGTMGLNGFQSGELPAAEPFYFASGQIDSQNTLFNSRYYGNHAYIPQDSGRPAPPVYINTGNTVYRVELCSQSVEAVFSSSTAIQSIAWSFTALEDDDDNLNHRLLIRTPRKLIILKHGRGSPLEIDLPKELENEDLSFWPSPRGYGWLTRTDHEVTYLYAINSNGSLELQRDVRLQNRIVSSSAELLIFAAIPVPVGFVLLFTLLMVVLPFFDPSSVSSRDIEVFAGLDFWANFAGITVIAIGLAILCYCQERRSHESRLSAIAWAILVLLGGPPAYLTYLIQRKRPREIAKMGVDDPLTTAIGRGTEILA